jgi:phosphate-selective porin OprO/OprP
MAALGLWAAATTAPAWAQDGGPTDAQIQAAVDAYLDAQQADSNTFRVYWKNGLRFDSANGDFKLKFGGRIFVDAAFYGDPDAPVAAALAGLMPPEGFDSGVEFRTARLYTSGVVWKYVQYKAQFDFAGGDADFKDVWVGLTNLDECWGCAFPSIRIGHFKEPFSLEELGSSRFMTFMERALPNALAPGRNTGIGITDDLYGERITYGLGVFGNSNDFGDHIFDDDENSFAGDRDGWALTARATFLPWAPCDCPCRFLEIGASARLEQDMTTLRVRQRPESHLAPRVVDTGTFAADSAFNWGAEMAFVYDRYSVQAEYISSTVDVPVGSDPTFSGWYAMASWLITGPCRNFKRSYAVFDRISPCDDFLGDDCCGWGAFELAVRYSTLDLTDAAIRGGEVDNFTVGLNWYLNPNMRIMANYIYSDITDTRGVAGANGAIDIFQMRFQVDF